jgi:hypothetical protein
MKRTPHFLGVLFALVALAFSAQGKSFPDLSAFQGNLKGTVSIVSLGTTYTGPCTVRAIVPKSGRSATFNISGSISGGGTTLPLSNVLKFAPSRNFTSQDLAFHIAGSSSTSATGRYSSSKRSINYSAPFSFSGATGTVSGTVRVHTTKTKQTVQISYTLVVNGSTTLPFTITASRKIK